MPVSYKVHEYGCLCLLLLLLRAKCDEPSVKKLNKNVGIFPLGETCERFKKF